MPLDVLRALILTPDYLLASQSPSHCFNCTHLPSHLMLLVFLFFVQKFAGDVFLFTFLIPGKETKGVLENASTTLRFVKMHALF